MKRATEHLFVELYQFINVKHYQEVNDVFDKAKEIERNYLIDFFKFFRDNGENHIGLTIEQFIDLYLKSNVTPESL
jgi:hypothetical protein